MDTMQKISPERFAEGLTLREFMAGAQKNREVFEENYRTFALNDGDAALLRDLGLGLKVVVLAEEWCGDVVRYLPVLARMAEVAQTWEVRVFYRDQNIDLAELWLKEGKYRAIPVMVFFDEQMNEKACYVEKPRAVYDADELGRRMFAAEHCDLPDAVLPYDQMRETTQALYSDYIRSFRAEHREQWQQFFVDEIKGKLAVRD